MYLYVRGINLGISTMFYIYLIKWLGP